MLRRFASTLPAVLCAAVLSGGCVVVGDMALDEHETLVETRDLDAGGRFELENVNGAVRIDTWKEPKVRIEAEKAASSRSALDDIEIEIDGEGDRVRVETHTPKKWGFGRSGQVEYTITLPESARVEVETVNGRVAVTNVAGGVRATTVNGRVEIEGAGGDVEAQTVNGSVEAELGAVPDGSRHRLATTNGSITLVLPDGVEGEFEAQTVNGGISTDFPLEVSGRWGPKSLHGRLGDGGGRVELETVNGAIAIRKR